MISADRLLRTGTILLFLIIPLVAASAQTPFKADSAASYLRTISVEIGPRPMGSPAEHRAMEFALEKFRAFGLQEAYILPMTVSASERSSTVTNTTSGTAVGVLPGKSARIIVLGAHIDSASPEVPGTNDDGSGSAAVIELARVLSRQPHESTIVFALFGGEEQGLCGSHHFVQNFPGIDRVVLMVQLDMTNGSDWLAPLIDVKDHSAPQWLVSAAYEEMHSPGYSGLSYPTHFLTLTNLMPGGIGSDHMPFLERGIPAIDFTSDINDPIHTPQDNEENFIPSGLKRSGDLVYRLVNRFDGGVPEESGGRYFLWQLGSVPLFIPIWALYAFSLLALAFATTTLLLLRRRRVLDEPPRTIPGLKLFLLMLIVQACTWFSPTVVALLKGSTHPWFSNFSGYFILGAVATIGGLWLALRLSRRLQLPHDPYRYYLRAYVVLIIFLLLLTFGSPQAGLYPAVTLVLIALAVLVRPPWLRMLLWALSPYMMLRLFFSEGFGLVTRSISAIPYAGFGSVLLTDAIMTLLFSVWLFPHALGFAAVQFGSTQDVLRLNSYRRSWGGYAAAISFVLTITFLLLQPTYSSKWRQVVHVEETFRSDLETGRADVYSSDFLPGLTLRTTGHDTLLEGRSARFVVADNLIMPDDWIHVDREISPVGPSGASFNALLKIRMKYRPYTLRITYSSPSEITEVNSAFASSQEGKRVSFRWYSFPDSSLLVPVSFRLEQSDTLQERIEAEFVQLPYPIEASKPLSNTVTRTRIQLNTALALEGYEH